MIVKNCIYIALFFLFYGCASKKEMMDIKNTKWILEEFEGDLVSDLKIFRIPEFHFKENQEFSGNDGCNGIGGKYIFENNKLELSEVMGTKMYCDNAFDRQYNFVFKAVTSTKKEGDYLVFYKGDVVVLKFKKV